MTKRTGLLRAARAVAAMEFALIVPVILLLFLGTADIATYLVSAEFARRAGVSAANAVSSISDVTPAMLSTVTTQVATQSAAYVWGSNSANGLIISTATSDADGNVKLVGQVKYPSGLSQTSSYGCKSGNVISNPPKPAEPNDMFIIAEIFYTARPFVFSAGLTGNTMLNSVHDYVYFRPRQPTTFETASTC